MPPLLLLSCPPLALASPPPVCSPCACRRPCRGVAAPGRCCVVFAVRCVCVGGRAVWPVWSGSLPSGRRGGRLPSSVSRFPGGVLWLALVVAPLPPFLPLPPVSCPVSAQAGRVVSPVATCPRVFVLVVACVVRVPVCPSARPVGPCRWPPLPVLSPLLFPSLPRSGLVSGLVAWLLLPSARPGALRLAGCAFCLFGLLLLLAVPLAVLLAVPVSAWLSGAWARSGLCPCPFPACGSLLASLPVLSAGCAAWPRPFVRSRLWPSSLGVPSVSPPPAAARGGWGTNLMMMALTSMPDPSSSENPKPLGWQRDATGRHDT